MKMMMRKEVMTQRLSLMTPKRKRAVRKSLTRKKTPARKKTRRKRKIPVNQTVVWTFLSLRRMPRKR